MLPRHRRTIVQYATNEDGERELRLYYGDKEISFDEPDLFAFGEAIARTPRFLAREASTWGPGLEWPRVRGLLEQLLDAGVLARAAGADAEPEERPAAVRPSPLPPAVCAAPRSWDDCAAITLELAGRAVDPGHLELVIPVFRVAHIVMDSDGRQVGEANVFPRALRLDVPTEWRTSNIQGSRFQDQRPMNVTAMRAMRAHWPQMMAGIARVRAAYLRRFPEAAGAWTVGHLERLSTAVLAVPTLHALRLGCPVPAALASMFRVTDGLRMVMHQMLFIPVGEPVLPPGTLVTPDQILDYAERNHSFHSDYGVCAGPAAMVREFLQVLIEGKGRADYAATALDAAFEDLDEAMDYAFLGLRAYAAVFSLWPAMTRAYERLAAGLEGAPEQAAPVLARLRGHLDAVRSATLLGSEEWRVDREHVYADMYDRCGDGLAVEPGAPGLATCLRPAPAPAGVLPALQAAVARRLGQGPHADATATTVLDFLCREQAVLRTAEQVQHRINRLLGRPVPPHPFSAADIDVHNRLLGTESRRLPYLIDELEDLFGIDITLDGQAMSIKTR